MFFHFLGDQGRVSSFSDYVVDPFTLLRHTWYLTNTRCMIEPFHVYRSKIWPWQVLQRFWICAEDYIRESNVYRSDFMGPCDTIINSFFLYIVELTKGLFVGNTLFYFHLEMEQHFLMHLLLLSVFASTFYGYPFFCILHVLNLMI